MEIELLPGSFSDQFANFQFLFQLEGNTLNGLQKQALNIFLISQQYFNLNALYELPESAFPIVLMIQKTALFSFMEKIITLLQGVFFCYYLLCKYGVKIDDPVGSFILSL